MLLPFRFDDTIPFISYQDNPVQLLNEWPIQGLNNLSIINTIL